MTQVELPDGMSSLGELTESEAGELAHLRRLGNNVQLEIGQLEIRKARMLGQFGQIESRAEEIMQAAGERLGLPSGSPWQIASDGKTLIGAKAD